MKAFLPFTWISTALLLIGCGISPYSSETKAAFQKAVTSIQKVEAITPTTPPGLLGAEVSKLGGYVDGYEEWYSTPLNVGAEASEAGISALTSGMGFFSGAAMSAANKAKPKREFYIIKFSGDTVIDVALVKS